MSTRGTLIMLLLVLGLGAFWYLHDVRGGQQREEAKTTEERLFPKLEEDQVASLRLEDLRTAGKPPLVLEKAEGRWILEGEQEFLAAQAEVEGLASQVAALKRESVIAEAPAAAALGQYGLDKPHYRLEIGTSGAGKPHALLLGDKTPDESGYYARSGDQGPVVEVASSFMGTLEKPLDELREKSPLALEPSDVTRIVLKPARGAEIVLVREEKSADAASGSGPETLERWRLEAPLQAPADPRKVSDFLWAWKGLQAGRFLKASEKVDFSRPVLRIELTGSGSTRPIALEVGPPVAVKPGMVYLRRSSPAETMVVELGEKQAELVGRRAEDFEDRHLLSFTEDEVDRISLNLQGKLLEARRIRGGWDVTRPARPVKDESARNTAISDLLYSMKDLEWTSRGGPEAPKAIQAPRASLSLHDKEGKVLGTLHLGGESPAGGFWVARTDTEQVYAVAQDPLPQLQDSLRRLEGDPAGAASPLPAPASPSPR